MDGACQKLQCDESENKQKVPSAKQDARIFGTKVPGAAYVVTGESTHQL